LWQKEPLKENDAMPYQPIIPADAPQLTVDVSDWRYKAAHDFAERSGWTQDQFSKALGDEARRVAASAPKPAPAAPAAPAPAPAAKPNFAAMNTREPIAATVADMLPVFHRTLGGRVTSVEFGAGSLFQRNKPFC
jgi:hypothetical protein